MLGVRPGEVKPVTMQLFPNNAELTSLLEKKERAFLKQIYEAQKKENLRLPSAM